MNFFGHAAVAHWASDSAEFVLGAMLPDFATMIGARPPVVAPGELSAGVAFHLDTDRVFHQTSTFQALQSEARRDLRARGLGRGSALAIGHVGVEILLDATLAREASAVRSYLAALSCIDARRLEREIHFRHRDEGLRLAELLRLLEARGVAPGAVDADIVTSRLERALHGRPRLSLDASGPAIVREWVKDTAPVVDAAADTLIAELRIGLRLAG